MDSVASIPKWAAATTGSAVGSAIAAPRAQISVTPQATSPKAAAARKLSGTAGGGTTAGTPGGRPGQAPVPGRGGTGGLAGTCGGAFIVSPIPGGGRAAAGRSRRHDAQNKSSRP